MSEYSNVCKLLTDTLQDIFLNSQKFLNEYVK